MVRFRIDLMTQRLFGVIIDPSPTFYANPLGIEIPEEYAGDYDYLNKQIDPQRRVLGVIRPSVEAVADFTGNGHIGILATSGTVASESYLLEIAKIHSEKGFLVTQQACPMWVPIVENNEMNSPGAAFFVQKYIDTILQADSQIDTLVLACTHYPLLRSVIDRFIPEWITVIQQGEIVARSLKDYLCRHPEMERELSRGGQIELI